MGYEVTFIWSDLNLRLGMISSLGSDLGFWMPKEGKEAKGGRILHESFCSLLWELLEFACEILSMGEEEQVATIA